MCNGQAEICYDTRAIGCDQYILRFEIPMCHCRFSLGSKDFSVQMHQPVGNRQTNPDHIIVAKSITIQVIEERAQRIVVCHEPQLSARVPRRHVGADKAKDVLMP